MQKKAVTSEVNNREILVGIPAPDINCIELGEQKKSSNSLREKDVDTLHKSVIQKLVQHAF